MKVKLLRLAAALALLAFVGLATPTRAFKRCPTFLCIVSIEGDCSCSWIVCPDGSVACGGYNP